MTNEDVIITSPNTIEAVIDAAGAVSVQLDKTGYTENEASVMAGKAAIAAAISNKGVTADKTDSFATLANKIGQISGRNTYPGKPGGMEKKDIDYLENIYGGAYNYNNCEEKLIFIYDNFPYFEMYSGGNQYYFIAFYNIPDINMGFGGPTEWRSDGNIAYLFDTWSFQGSTDRRILSVFRNAFNSNQLVLNPYTSSSYNRIMSCLVCYDSFNNEMCMGCVCDSDNYQFSSNTVNVRQWNSNETIIQENRTYVYSSVSNANCFQHWVSLGNNFNIFTPFNGSHSAHWNPTDFTKYICNADKYFCVNYSLPIKRCYYIEQNIEY